MDAQHKKMMGIINQLHEAMLAGKASHEIGLIINEMVDYAQYHFSSEEKLLTTLGYPALNTQKMSHNGFVKKVKEFQSEFEHGKLALSVEVLDFQKDWWSKHILGEDMKYGPYIK